MNLWGGKKSIFNLSHSYIKEWKKEEPSQFVCSHYNWQVYYFTDIAVYFFRILMHIANGFMGWKTTGFLDLLLVDSCCWTSWTSPLSHCNKLYVYACVCVLYVIYVRVLSVLLL